MLALVIFDYGPVTAVSAPVIGPVYLGRFWGVIHAETQPSRQPDTARRVSSGELGPRLSRVIFEYGPVTAVSAPGIGPVYSARFWGVILAESQPSRQPDPA
ncbi:hypothetical protein VZT92_026716 [Zoarces viviparus]